MQHSGILQILCKVLYALFVTQDKLSLDTVLRTRGPLSML